MAGKAAGRHAAGATGWMGSPRQRRGLVAAAGQRGQARCGQDEAAGYRGRRARPGPSPVELVHGSPELALRETLAAKWRQGLP